VESARQSRDLGLPGALLVDDRRTPFIWRSWLWICFVVSGMIVSVWCRYYHPTWELLALAVPQLLLALWPLSFFNNHTLRRACATLCLWVWCAVIYIVLTVRIIENNNGFDLVQLSCYLMAVCLPLIGLIGRMPYLRSYPEFRLNFRVPEEFDQYLAIRDAEAEPPVLPVSIIKNVDTIKFPTCSICITDFGMGDAVKILPCSHLFHVECIDRWLAEKLQCPTCRRTVLPLPV